MIVKCIISFGSFGLLTHGKEYEVIKSVRNSYVIKRDDDSIDKVDKTRFTIIKP